MNILYIDISQFGYHTDAFYYARHLSSRMNVTYIGCHQGKKDILPGNVNVIDVHCTGNNLVRHFWFYKACIRELHAHNYDCVVICYTIFCSILRILFPKKTMVVDVRTGYVEPSATINAFFNAVMRIELSLFRNVTFISKELACFLKFKRPYVVVPVGAEWVETAQEAGFDRLALLYVGTFFGRRIDITIRGFKRFLDSYGNSLPATYTLVGFGPDHEIHRIKNEIDRLDLADHVLFKGEVRHPEIREYFLQSNIGVSFVPVTPFYNCQPPTKNFEYLMYGMALLATATEYNMGFVKPEFGVLIPDTEEGFCEGLKQIARRLGSFDSEKIRNIAKDFTYEAIVERILAPYLLSL